MKTFIYKAEFESFTSQGTVDGETLELAKQTIIKAYADRGHKIININLEEKKD